MSSSTAFQAFLCIRENFYHTSIVFFTTSAEVSSSLKLHLFVFLMFINFFQIMTVVLKIFNIFNKSNYLFQQHYFNHFHFT